MLVGYTYIQVGLFSDIPMVSYTCATIPVVRMMDVWIVDCLCIVVVFCLACDECIIVCKIECKIVCKIECKDRV